MTEETEVTEPNATEPKTEPPKVVDSGVQKRINELTRARHDQQRRAEAAEARLAELEKTQKQTAPPAETEKRKTLADFNYDDVAYEDYLAERVTKRASETATKEATKAVEEREQKKAQETKTAERQTTWRARVDTFAKDHPDFVEKVYAEDVDFSDAVAEAIADSELGPQLAYHLAQHPEELSRISRLSPVAVGRELGKLEAKLEKPAAEAEENASAVDPEPPKPKPGPTPKLTAVSDTARRPSTTSPQSDRLSDDEWFKAEQQRLAARSNRNG